MPHQPAKLCGNAFVEVLGVVLRMRILRKYYRSTELRLQTNLVRMGPVSIHVRHITAWCSKIGSLTTLDACNSGASSDVRTNFTAPRCIREIATLVGESCLKLLRKTYHHPSFESYFSRTSFFCRCYRPASPVILWIVLGGKPKWLPLNFGWWTLDGELGML